MPTSGFLDSLNWRIFHTIKKNKNYIDFYDYLEFMLLLFHGNANGRSRLTFDLIS